MRVESLTGERKRRARRVTVRLAMTLNPRKHLQERKERMNIVARKGKNAKNFGPPTPFGPPLLGIHPSLLSPLPFPPLSSKGPKQFGLSRSLRRGEGLPTVGERGGLPGPPSPPHPPNPSSPQGPPLSPENPLPPPRRDSRPLSPERPPPAERPPPLPPRRDTHTHPGGETPLSPGDTPPETPPEGEEGEGRRAN